MLINDWTAETIVQKVKLQVSFYDLGHGIIKVRH